MVLRAGYAALALKLQEAMDSSDALSANDIQARLRDAIADCYRGSGTWAYYVDHFGDSESGDVIYSCDGDMKRAPYSISSDAGAAKCIIDHENAEDVVPRTIYEVEQDEEDHYAAMEALYRGEGYPCMPLYERFISKKERDAASSDDFAGKGKSYPILKPEDVMAAARSIGRAGDSNKGPSGIKASIIRIAKRKGWEKYLPKAWKTADSAKESAVSGQSSIIKLVESAVFCEELALRESTSSRTHYPIKIIDPGEGTTAFYPREVLQKEAAKFKPGTLMFWNHPTPAEEAARPEGNLDHLAAITTSQGEWRDNGPKGPGIYADAKVMADYAEKVAERAPHIGLSIRAGGERDGSKHVNGKPVLKEFSYIESVDYVTKAGRGGLALAEAARDAGILTEAAVAPPIQTQEAAEMTADEAKKLVEAAVSAATAPLLERALRGDAREEAARLLESVTLPPAAKTRIVERAIAVLPQKDGALDVDKLRETVVAEAKAEGEYIASITGGQRVHGMGMTVVTPPKPEELAAREARKKAEFEADVKVYERQGMSRLAAEFAARGRDEEDDAA